MKWESALSLLAMPFCCILISTGVLAQTSIENDVFVHTIRNVQDHIVLLNNQRNLIPLTDLDKRNIVSVHFGFPLQNTFDSLLNKYDHIDTLNSASYFEQNNFYKLEDDLKYFNTIIVALNESLIENTAIRQFLQDIDTKKDLIIAYFGNGKKLSSLNDLTAPIAWYEKEDYAAAFISPQLLFGGISAQNKLPQNFSAKYKKGAGFRTAVTRLKFTVPEEVGINSNSLLAIDTVAQTAITEKATPGLVVLAAKDGKVIFNKAYGDHTYQDSIPDKITDLFDLASVTKVTATVPTVMHLYDKHKLNIDTTIGYYLAQARISPMNDIRIREVLLHQAGFVPFIPFYKNLQKNDYASDSSAEYPTKVANHFYIRKNYFKEVMWPEMLQSPIKTRGKYVYSDISMYTMQQIVEQITGIPLNKYVLDTFYRPLGMQTAGYLPRARFSPDQIIPTEEDTSFRHQLLDGYVHDEGAALKGGVAGHAGLFANSIDLAIYYQMLLNKGRYGGVQYFSPETVTYFTGKRSTVSRRGLGFDRADVKEDYPSRTASPETFGHTGFTGISVWVDPIRNLVYIFLSNRVNPHRSTKLYELGTRSKIEDILDNAVDKASNQ